MERGCWVGKGTVQEIKTVPTSAEQREPMFSRRRKTPMSRARREKRKGETNTKLNETTGRQPKILKFYIQ